MNSTVEASRSMNSATARSRPVRRRSVGTKCGFGRRSEEHTSELQSPCNLVCRLLLEKKKNKTERSRSMPDIGVYSPAIRPPSITRRLFSAHSHTSNQCTRLYVELGVHDARSTDRVAA